MVEKVQAIENFNENPLLKGLVNAEDVAINIQLKKGKTDMVELYFRRHIPFNPLGTEIRTIAEETETEVVE